MIVHDGIKYPDYQLGRPWGFAFAVKDYADKHLPYYFFPVRVAEHFKVPHVQAALALELMCAAHYMERTHRGYYHVLGEQERKRRQDAQLQADRAMSGAK